MKGNRRTVVASSVFVVSLATGYVTLNGNADAARSLFFHEPAAPLAVPAAASGEVAPVVRAKAMPALPAEPAIVALATPAPETFEGRAPVADHGAATGDVADTESFSPFGLRCETMLGAEPGPAASARLTLNAPCHGGRAVSVRHGSLKFTDVTGADGVLVVEIPALSVNAEFEVTLDDGTVVEASLPVPEAETYERVALQWQGETGLELHAFEFGASYGDAGHVHALAPYSPERALRQGAGYLTRLGRDTVPGGWTSEVYSFPSAGARDRGIVRISIEAEITQATCGREVSAETLRQVNGAGLSGQTLRLSVPGCDAVGQYLVLADQVPDMVIASK